MVDAQLQQRIAKLEGLLAKIQHRRNEPRVLAAGAAPVADDEPVLEAPFLPGDDDEVVDLSDEDVVELGDSAPPPAPEEQALVVSQRVVSGAATEATSARDAEQPEPSGGGFNWPSSVPPKPEAQALPSEPPIASAGPADDGDFGLDLSDEDEEPPASSRRPIASSMDEALADAAAREVPLKTPPPESGPQEAAPVVKETVLSDSSAPLPGAADADMMKEGLPTSAQLGNTVPLEEGGPADFEVDGPEPAGESAESAPASEDFEIRLPKREAAGSYDADLAPPPEARRELEAHRERGQTATEQAELAESEAAIAPQPEEPSGVHVTERKLLQHDNVTEVTGAPQRFRTGNFLELLDASLKLGKD